MLIKNVFFENFRYTLFKIFEFLRFKNSQWELFDMGDSTKIQDFKVKLKIMLFYAKNF